MLIITLLILAVSAVLTRTATNSDLIYKSSWDAILRSEQKFMTGGTTILNKKESKVDDLIQKIKNDEVSRGETDTSSYPPAMHFFHAKPLVEKSRVFKFIRKMPKGAVLHLHNSAAVSSEWVIQNLTYRPEVRMCQVDGVYYFTARKNSKSCGTDSVSVQEMRAANKTKELFDAWLETFINLNVTEPELEYPFIDIVWKKFDGMFDTIKELLTYRPIFEDYHYQVLSELYEDNVMYVEMRSSLSALYDAQGRTYNDHDVANILQNVINRFKDDHPNFLGAKVIYSKFRGITGDTLYNLLADFVRLRNAFPELLVGFDLVGQEDNGTPLANLSHTIKQYANENIKYFFHAGETNWFGTQTDLNLIDAILLNATRIGHGYALIKHPVLWNAVKNRDIAIEVSPLSNQVLKLVADLRNHPAAFYISENIPMVICNDDPGFWGSKGLSYDFYYAFMAFAPAYSGFKFLKQLAWNSLKYSILTVPEKHKAAEIFKLQWDQFLDDVLKGTVI